MPRSGAPASALCLGSGRFRALLLPASLLGASHFHFPAKPGSLRSGLSAQPLTLS